MFKNKAKIAPESTYNPCASRALKRALDPGRLKGLRAHDARSARKNTFFHLKICFFKLNTVYAIYFASLIFRESGLQDIFASG